MGPGGYYRHIGATMSLINFRYVLWMEEMDIETEEGKLLAPVKGAIPELLQAD